jgi:hypothetical protein
MYVPVQTSCSWVLKESRAVYKAASEGIMNLADKFFEMERAQALQVGQLRACERVSAVGAWFGVAYVSQAASNGRGHYKLG